MITTKNIKRWSVRSAVQHHKISADWFLALDVLQEKSERTLRLK